MYLYEASHGWLRRRKKARRGACRNENAKLFKSEAELFKTLKDIFGSSGVMSGVHPIWALSSKGALLEYDIAVKDKKLLIEYNGQQHYEYPNRFHKLKKYFLAQQRRDKRKEKLAKDNGWKFMVVKYNEPVTHEYIYKKLKNHGYV